MGSDLTERQGVESVRSAIVNELGWYPREPVRPDYGIDLYAECADEQGRPTGRLFAMQIKSGASYFAEEREGGFVFRGEPRHLRYWTGHSLPVVLVLFDPRENHAYWVAVREDLVEETGAGWKIVVPRNQLLDTNARVALERLAEGDPYTLALRRLRADVTWMGHLAHGGRVLLEAEEWVNKTSGRGEIRLIAEASSGEVDTTAEWSIFAPWQSYESVLPALFPWADLAIDEYTYDEADHDEWTLECGVWDSEDQTYHYTATFSEWSAHRSTGGLRPYVDNGEVASWRLELSLNDLGLSFVTVDDYLSDAG